MIDRKVNAYFDLQPVLHHIYEAKLVNGYLKNKSVLDIGCWSGQFLSLVQEKAKTTGLDPDKNAVEFAKKYRKGKYIVGSALQLPFQDNSFDIVTMWDVIEHLPKHTEQKAIEEVERVLKKGGVFALSTPTTHPLSILLDPAFFLIGHRHYSEEALTKLLYKNGLRIVKIEYGGGIWALIKSNLELLMKHAFGKKIKFGLLEKLVEKEFEGKGFSAIHIIAKK